MISKEDAEKLGFRIKFKTDSKSEYDNYFCVSYDSGETWKNERPLYNDSNEILKNELGKFYVNEILKPELGEGQSLCNQCAHKGRVGIVQFAGIVTGTEKVCVERWDGDYNYTEDMDVHCRYAQWKCCNCGHIADSDYA